MSDIERRVSYSKIELRAATPGKSPSIGGLAARYDSLSNPLPAGRGDFFKEKIAPGAFRSVLKDLPDCKCLINHDPNLLLGRTTSGTLQLTETKDGLAFHCDMPNVSYANDLYEMMKRGDISQCSFSFSTDDDDWDDGQDDEGNRCVIRTINSFAALRDVSVVTYPAYSDTVALARSLPESVLAEARSYAARIGVTPTRKVELVSAEERREILGRPSPEQIRRDVEQVQREIYKEML